MDEYMAFPYSARILCFPSSSPGSTGSFISLKLSDSQYFAFPNSFSHSWMNILPISLKYGESGERTQALYLSSKPPQCRRVASISGCFSIKAGGTKPANAGATGSIPSERILSSILCCSSIWLSCQESESGPSKELRFPILCHGRCAAPVKKASASSELRPSFIHTLLAMASLATLARGIFTPCRAIQSSSSDHLSQSQYALE